jgi:hypothetical protein
MDRVNGASLIMVGALLLVMGLVLRWELVDWLIDAVGFLFLLAGAGFGIVGVIRLMTRKEARSGGY